MLSGRSIEKITMTYRIWVAVVVVTALYTVAVLLFGFEGPIALSMNFARVSLTFAVLILYVPVIMIIFKEVPAPSRDYLLAGIICDRLSSFLFSVSNEAGRVFDYDTSVFTNPVAGYFSLLLIAGAAFYIAAPDATVMNTTKRTVAISIGIVVGVLVGFVAPFFR